MSEQLKKRTFTFEGRSIDAREGQSIAGALHQAGVRTLSRSVKYHIPRGYTCGFGACGDCPLNVNGMPSTVSCTTPVRGGEQVRREQGLPSTKFDLLRTADFMRPWLGAGFQFKLFAKQPRLSKLAGSILALLAGGGRMPSAAAVERSRVKRVESIATDVVVVGGAVSGLTAALAAADSGAAVVVVDRDFTGGRSGVRTEPVLHEGVETAPSQLFDSLFAAVQAHPGIRLATGVAIGWIDEMLPVVNGDLRLEISPRTVILATGSYEVPMMFPGHDRPGVMLADAALKLADVEGVRPGRRAVVVQADPRATDVADRLRKRGVDVVAVVEKTQIECVTGWSRATGVLVSAPGAKRTKISADLVCIAGARRPAEELALHLRYADRGSHDLVLRDGGELPEISVSVGSAAGSARYSTSVIREHVEKLVRSSAPPETAAGNTSPAAT